MHSLCIVHLRVAFNNIEVLNVVMDTRQWVSLALISGYQIFRIADGTKVCAMFHTRADFGFFFLKG
jgi:hypothetical protein